MNASCCCISSIEIHEVHVYNFNPFMEYDILAFMVYDILALLPSAL